VASHIIPGLDRLAAAIPIQVPDTLWM